MSQMNAQIYPDTHQNEGLLETKDHIVNSVHPSSC